MHSILEERVLSLSDEDGNESSFYWGMQVGDEPRKWSSGMILLDMPTLEKNRQRIKEDGAAVAGSLVFTCANWVYSRKEWGEQGGKWGESGTQKAVKKCLIEGNILLRKGKMRRNEVCVRRMLRVNFSLKLFLFPKKGVGKPDIEWKHWKLF